MLEIHIHDVPEGKEEAANLLEQELAESVQLAYSLLPQEERTALTISLRRMLVVLWLLSLNRIEDAKRYAETWDQRLTEEARKANNKIEPEPLIDRVAGILRAIDTTEYEYELHDLVASKDHGYVSVMPNTKQITSLSDIHKFRYHMKRLLKPWFNCKIENHQLHVYPEKE